MNDTYDIPLKRVLNDSISNNEVLKKENVNVLSHNKEGSLEHQMEYDDYILLINREWGHYREISDRGLDVLTEQ